MDKRNLAPLRLGEEKYNLSGQKMKIIEYINSKNITVKFEDGYIVKGDYKEFNNGSIKDAYAKCVYNIGYIGKGDYRAKINHKNTKQYDIWSKMLSRCYSEKRLMRQPTYTGCTVAPIWHNFQNYAKWYDDNFYEVENQEMHVDKDILFKGNKIYSPETCVFVPENINSLFTKNNIRRGDYPIGVYLRKSNNRYCSQCSGGNGIQINLGDFDTPEEAFVIYKDYKEELIKQIAYEHKIKYSQFPQKLYDAMLNYIVEITD